MMQDQTPEEQEEAAYSDDEGVEGTITNVSRYPEHPRGSDQDQQPAATPVSRAAKEIQSGGDVGPSLPILIGLVILVAIGLIIAIIFFAGDPYGPQGFF